jgi:protein TonB
MNERWLFTSFAASSLIHLALIPVAVLMMHARPSKPVNLPIEIIEIPRKQAPEKVDATPSAPPPAPPSPRPKPRQTAQKMTAPKLVSKPEISAPKPQPAPGNVKEEIKEPEPEPVAEPPAPLASLPAETGSPQGSWNAGARPGPAEGSAAGAGDLFGEGDVGVVGGSAEEGGGGGKGDSGLGRGSKGSGAGGGIGAGEALSGLARPLGGYQVKPRYPESARRAGAQGVTTLRVRVLENGRVGTVIVETSAGFRDLDFAAAEAVKKWRFEPAHRGKEAVAVWVRLPVKFELH